jgi:hypothetical protein
MCAESHRETDGEMMAPKAFLGYKIHFNPQSVAMAMAVEIVRPWDLSDSGVD